MLSAKQTKKKHNKVSAGFQPQEEDETRWKQREGFPNALFYRTDVMYTLGFSKTGCSDSAEKPHTLSENSPWILKPDVSIDVK